MICSKASFVKSIRNYSLLDWSLEQKWLIILLVFLIFYNSKSIDYFRKFRYTFYDLDPLHPFIFLYNKSLPLIIDTFFQTNFFCVLLFFWLAIYHGIRQVRFLSFLFSYHPFSLEYSSISFILSSKNHSHLSYLDILNDSIFHSS